MYSEDYTVRLEPVVAEWAKTLPGGLSQEIRVHLRRLYDVEHSSTTVQPTPAPEPTTPALGLA